MSLVQKLMSAHRWALMMIALALLSGCGWGQYFQLEWDEEVELSDGRVIVVHLAHTYERTNRWRRYEGAIHRDTEIRLPVEGEYKATTQLFKGFSPLLIDQHQGVWYSVLYGGYRKGTREMPGQDWGDGRRGQWAIKLVSGAWIPISMDEVPEDLQRPNMLLLTGSVNDLADMAGGLITVRQKEAWSRSHPPGYVLIARPPKNQTPEGVVQSTRETEGKK